MSPPPYCYIFNSTSLLLYSTPPFCYIFNSTSLLFVFHLYGGDSTSLCFSSPHLHVQAASARSPCPDAMKEKTPVGRIGGGHVPGRAQSPRGRAGLGACVGYQSRADYQSPD